MASFLVRIFREQSDYRAVVVGWGTVRSPTLRVVREEVRKFVRAIVGGPFSPRTNIERGERVEVLRIRLELKQELSTVASSSE